MNQNPVYFWGYSGSTIDHLQAMQAKTEALILDARFKPYSRFRPEWNQQRLAELFGTDYQHVPALGNRNYKGGADEIEIIDLEAGITLIEASGRPVIILCTCKAPEGCHTTVIRDEMARRGYAVVELRDRQLSV